MLNISNYEKQSQNLPVQDGLQLTIFKLADDFTRIREISKCGAVIGLVVSASSYVFNFDSTTAVTWTAITGVIWGLSRTCAKKYEPEAKEIIKHLKEIKDGKDQMSESEARFLGLVA